MALLKDITLRRGLRTAALALLTAVLCLPPPLPAKEAASEYSLKAVFLYNFCQFINWPPSTFSGSRDPIVIGILGNNPFGSRLQEAVQGEVIRGRPIRIEYLQRASQARCHLLFVSSADMWRLGGELPDLHRRGIATVGETESFLQQGGMIALVATQNRVRLRVNLPAVRSASIEMSSKLLRVADINR